MTLWRPIQQHALGLLTLLGVKNNGQNPDELTSVLSPMIDVGEQMLQQNCRTVFGVTETTVVSGATLIYEPWTDPTGLGNPLLESGIIPPDETWYVWDYTVNLVNYAGTELNSGIYLACDIPVGSGFCLLSEVREYYTAVGGSNVVTGCNPRRWFPPNTQFGWGCGKLSVAAGDVTVSAQLYMHVTKVKL